MKKTFKKIYIEITNCCNLRCSFCSPILKPKRYMNEEEFEHILKEIQSKTDTIYLHVKGEPLLHPKIKEFLDLAYRYGLKVNITTNGILLPNVLEKIKNCKSLNKINISLHCEQNIPDYFENVFNAADKFPNNVTIVYRMWTLKNGILDELSTKTVEKIKQHYNLNTEIVDKIKYEKNIKISNNKYVDKDNEFDWPTIESKHKSNGFCMALKTQIAILCDGTVVPCCLDSNGCINLGNIYKEKIEDIIKSERYNNLKKSFQERKINEELCLKCTYKERFNK